MALSVSQIGIVARIAEVVLPRDETPGAADSPVVEMVTMVVNAWPGERLLEFEVGLDALDQLATALFGSKVLALSPGDMAALVATIAKDPAWAALFFGLRALICLSFFALPVGYLFLGMPGPNVDQGGLEP